MHHVPSHVARGSAETGKNRMFLRAVGLGGKRSTIASERNSPNARVRTMSTSATTDVSHVRARARPGTAGGDAPRPSPESAVRPGNTTPDWRRSGRKAKLAVRRELRARVRGTGAVPLTVRRNALCSRPTRCRPATPAETTQCDAHITPRVCRRRPKSAVCAVLRACRGMAWLAGQRRSAWTMPAAAPPPPPRRTRRACFELVRVGEAFACADSGRFGGRPRRRRYGRHSLTRSCS
jgi:hypothetical protein